MTELNERAMLMAVTICGWSARKHDRKVSDDVAARHNAASDVGRYNKVLVSKEALAEINKIAGEARRFFYFNTLPWTDEGYRILLASNFDEVSAKMRKFRDDYEAAVRKFCDNYDAFKADAKKRLNGLFREEDYPSADEINDRFGFYPAIMPLPDAADFRVSLSNEAIQKIRSDLTERVTNAVDDAAHDAWWRVHDVVAHMVERLDAYTIDAKGKRQNTFHDTLVSNIHDLASVLPRLNIKGDGELDRIAKDMLAKLCAVEPETLRTDAKARKRVKMDAQAILDRMKAYTGLGE